MDCYLPRPCGREAEMEIFGDFFFAISRRSDFFDVPETDCKWNLPAAAQSLPCCGSAAPSTPPPPGKQGQFGTSGHPSGNLYLIQFPGISIKLLFARERTADNLSKVPPWYHFPVITSHQMEVCIVGTGIFGGAGAGGNSLPLLIRRTRKRTQKLKCFL